MQAHYSGMMEFKDDTQNDHCRRFNEKYNYNLLDVLQTARLGGSSPTKGGNNNLETQGNASRGCGKRDRGLETPALPANRPMMTPATAVGNRKEKCFVVHCCFHFSQSVCVFDGPLSKFKSHNVNYHDSPTMFPFLLSKNGSYGDTIDEGAPWWPP
jgi:hypothetical protein